MDVQEAIQKIQRACLNHPELLRPEYYERVKKGAHPITGHCYTASEALYHLFPGQFKPMVTRVGEGILSTTHWFLIDNDGNVFDPTIHQFSVQQQRTLYDNARGCGFLTKNPSKRTQVILKEVGQ